MSGFDFSCGPSPVHFPHNRHLQAPATVFMKTENCIDHGAHFHDVGRFRRLYRHQLKKSVAINARPGQITISRPVPIFRGIRPPKQKNSCLPFGGQESSACRQAVNGELHRLNIYCTINDETENVKHSPNEVGQMLNVPVISGFQAAESTETSSPARPYPAS
ncbi:MAG: hypothetical protein BM485_14550 [Desulfobulbaceae bacterium DB1]|nr:MAG: hypothetical protein BM485_14550 [Desulfobulbaceae bacterium DB1]